MSWFHVLENFSTQISSFPYSILNGQNDEIPLNWSVFLKHMIFVEILSWHTIHYFAFVDCVKCFLIFQKVRDNQVFVGVNWHCQVIVLKKFLNFLWWLKIKLKVTRRPRRLFCFLRNLKPGMISKR